MWLLYNDFHPERRCLATVWIGTKWLKWRRCKGHSEIASNQKHWCGGVLWGACGVQGVELTLKVIDKRGRIELIWLVKHCFCFLFVSFVCLVFLNVQSVAQMQNHRDVQKAIVNMPRPGGRWGRQWWTYFGRFPV